MYVYNPRLVSQIFAAQNLCASSANYPVNFLTQNPNMFVVYICTYTCVSMHHQYINIHTHMEGSDTQYTLHTHTYNTQTTHNTHTHTHTTHAHTHERTNAHHLFTCRTPHQNTTHLHTYIHTYIHTYTSTQPTRITYSHVASHTKKLYTYIIHTYNTYIRINSQMHNIHQHTTNKHIHI